VTEDPRMPRGGTPGMKISLLLGQRGAGSSQRRLPGWFESRRVSESKCWD